MTDSCKAQLIDAIAHNTPLTTTPAAALACFDQLPGISCEAMLGHWRGGELSTGHSIDGLLTVAQWHGKHFESTECVHPLVMSNGQGGRYCLKPQPQLMRLVMQWPALRPPWIKPISPWVGQLLSTHQSQARLRMIEYRGKLSAAMIYDALPICDVFRQLDDHSVMGLMDDKAMEQPYFFWLTREQT